MNTLRKKIEVLATALVLVVALVGSAHAAATTLVFDSYGDTTFGKSYGASTAFTDDFLFTIAAGFSGDVSTTIIAGTKGGSWSAYLTNFFFYDQADLIKTPIVPSDSAVFDPNHILYIARDGLAAGSYGLRVVGQTLTLPGSYAGNVSLSVTAVPEPGTYAMMLAGLGMLGFMVRRRTPSA